MIHIDVKKFSTDYKKLLTKHFKDDAKIMLMNLNSVYKVMNRYQSLGWGFTVKSGSTYTEVMAFHPDINQLEIMTESKSKEILFSSSMRPPTSFVSFSISTNSLANAFFS